MDQEPWLDRVPLSIPKILSPGNNDSFDGKAVTIAGTADHEVPIRIWDWLSPVAMTTADSDGYWSTTLRDVEVGDHMFCAEAYRDSPARSARSQVVSVRIAPRPRPSPASASPAPRHWKLPSVGFARRLAGYRRSDSGAKVAGQIEPGGDRKPADDIARPGPVSPSADAPRSSMPSAEDTPSNELAAAVTPLPLDSGTERESVADELPVEVRAIGVANEPEVIEAPIEVLLTPAEPTDLGVADRALDPAPPIDAATHVVPVSAALERIWTERIMVAPPPTTHASDTGG